MIRQAVVAASGALALLAAVAMVGAEAAGADAQRAGEWWLGSPMNITQAWTITQGAGVKVALIDSGVDGTHPDLVGALADGTDVSGMGAPDGLLPLPNDEEPQHGTGMAVFIAGRGHGPGNASGLIGIAPQATIMSISDTSGTKIKPETTTNAFHWAVDHGAQVINMSFGGTYPTAADIAYAQQHDVVLVAGTGNEGGLPGFGTPANLRGVVAVGGIDQDLTLDPTSNYGGPGRTGNVTTDGVAVVAPDSTGPGGKPGIPQATLVSKGSYTTNYGTSGSTAFVSGVVALIRAKFPTMNAANVVNRLIMTAHKTTTDAYSTKFGFGIPDAYAALTANVPTVCENPLGSEATNSFGIWQSIIDKTTYQPTCDGSSSPTPSATPSDTGDTVGSAAPTTHSSSAPKIFVGVAAIVLVLVVALAIIFSRRGNRPTPAAPIGYQPPQQPPNYYPPPPS